MSSTSIFKRELKYNILFSFISKFNKMDNEAMRNKFYFSISLSSWVQKLSKLNKLGLRKIIGSFKLAKVTVTYRNWRVVKNKIKIKTYNHNISLKQACTTCGSRAKFAQNFVYMTCLIIKVSPVHEIWVELKNSSSDFFNSVFSSLIKLNQVFNL